MRRLSSIFSFDTLQLRVSWQAVASVAVAVTLVAVAEGGTRQWLGTLPEGVFRSRIDLVQSHVRSAQQSTADIWLIGNSTLDHGLDADTVAQEAGTSVLKLAHGSGTPPAYAALLEEYVAAAARPPRVLVIAFTKDDLNTNGLRRGFSQRYNDYAAGLPIEPERHLKLRAERSLLRRATYRELERTYAAWRNQTPPGSLEAHIPEDQPYVGGALADDDPAPYEHIRDWQLDRQGLRDVTAAARAQGIERIAFVLMPITSALGDYHDRQVEDMPYEQVRLEVAALARELSVAYLDMGIPTRRHDLFFDTYHPNLTGKPVFSRLLGAWLASDLEDRPALDEAALTAALQVDSTNSVVHEDQSWARSQSACASVVSSQRDP